MENIEDIELLTKEKVTKSKRKKQERKLSPLRQRCHDEGKRQEEEFQVIVQTIDEWIGFEEIEKAGNELDNAVKYVEMTHYLESTVRQNHVKELYRLSNA